MARFFSELAEYLNGSGSCPELADYLPQIDYTELHRFALSGQTGNASYPGAAAVEVVHHLVAVQREFGLRTKGKIQYYDDGQSETGNEAAYYDAMKLFYVNMLRGNYVPGATA